MTTDPEGTVIPLPDNLRLHQPNWSTSCRWRVERKGTPFMNDNGWHAAGFSPSGFGPTVWHDTAIDAMMWARRLPRIGE